MMPSTYEDARTYVEGGRTKRDRPIANNTRLVKRGDKAIAVKLHGTDVVTFHDDGRITLSSGGWRTNTTADRIRNYSPAHLFSERGVWYVRAEPDDNDPRPERITRSIVHPFKALDPGPEPIKSEIGCIAGTYVDSEHEVLVSKREAEDEDAGWMSRPYDHESDYFAGYRMEPLRTYYREAQWAPYGEYLEPIPGGMRQKLTSEQCPHCKLFDAQHSAWDIAYNGDRWGNRQHRGYRQMTEMLERYGDEATWLEAAREDYRTVRANRQAIREWEERNRVLFEDGMLIDGDGYAKRPDLKAMERDARKRAKLDRKRARIAKFVDYCMEELANGRVPMPSGGDCWGCALRDANDRSIETMGTDHLEQHIRDRYAVPSMFINAMLTKGYNPTGIGMYFGIREDSTHLGIGLGSEEGRYPVIRTALMHYLTKHLLPEWPSK